MNDSAARQATRLDAIHGRYDPWLLAVSCALACVGLVMVGSASIGVADGHDVGPFYFLTRHAVFLAIGLVAAVWLMRTELKTIEQHNQLLLLVCLALLLAVFVPGIGKSVNGARRWLNLGVSNFQAVEAVKLLYILWLASYLKRFSEDISATWLAMLKPIGVAVVLVAMLLMQPDFGSSSLILAITAGMLVLGGVNMPRMFGPVLIGLPVLAIVAIAEPYRVSRLTSFLNPWADPFKTGYQLTNALMAVGRGEWLGVGLGASVQKLSYLPEAHTDFILAVIAEEFGFLGVCLVVGLYALLAGRAFWIGLKCVEMRRHFSGYIAFGIALWMSLQSFVSIGVNLGLLPTKGLTLPMISYGGSSVIMTCAALGVLLRVSYELDRAQRQVARLRNEAAQPSAGVPATANPLPGVAGDPARGTSRLRQRAEPSLGRTTA
ncbi:MULTISPECIES: putative lipid II flippase FtsW [unclassified Lysobacter]|uniref:putative lipid II flippase FtsW n=1 Tax=unclassified Lysobacter TaxID=2635362 RepID=UPI0006F67702|nr:MULTISPECIES: putative lipid II flippase FtsW [unclassified Lysobacter]KQZ56296.1 cell division protein FtsW [Lysobacter sp. Root559]KRA76728.1 cell division protein FtsW [Lysobacter sp. Root667]KRC35266.1 cell division protein FtsW [Lysobacter sp. Root76]KRD70956.1 cell division protein FtsW [Lysobacter sp. Root96]